MRLSTSTGSRTRANRGVGYAFNGDGSTAKCVLRIRSRLCELEMRQVRA